MKYLLSVLFVSLSFIGLSAQSEVEFLEAFGQSDMTVVTSLLSEKVTLCIEDDVKELSKTEAIKKLNAFVADQHISKKKILHNGTASDKGSSYKVARIITASGTYRVFAYSELNGTVSSIKEIRIFF